MDALWWVGFISWVWFTYSQIYNMSAMNVKSLWYMNQKTKYSIIPPNGVFFPVWMVLYGLISASVLIFWNDESRDFYDVTLSLYVANIILNKLWTPLFFGWKRFGLALFDLILVIATGIAILVFTAYVKAWWSFGLFLPYVLWCVYAMMLNALFVYDPPSKRLLNRSDEAVYEVENARTVPVQFYT